MPSIVGILMSVTITSYRAPSILFLAACPDCTVSTRCPSRRRAMSSISQMERSSSQTRILAMRPPFGRSSCQFRGRSRSSEIADRWRAVHVPFRVTPAQPQHESSSLLWLRSSPHFTFMGLHDLVNHRQAKACAALEVGLEGFKDLFRLLGSHSCSSVGKADLPVVFQAFDSHFQSATVTHGANCVLPEIPENLFDLVAVSE